MKTKLSLGIGNKKLLFVIHPFPQGDHTKPPGTCLKQAEVVHHLWVVKFFSIRGHQVLGWVFFRPRHQSAFFWAAPWQRRLWNTRVHWVQEFSNPSLLGKYLEENITLFSPFLLLLFISRLLLSSPWHSGRSTLSQNSAVLGSGHLWNSLYRIGFASIFPSASGHFCPNLSLA